jgi:alpha-beta hydrolase superfamily lysophospholipase
MATETRYRHRSTVQKLGVGEDERVEVAGDVGRGLRDDVKEAIGRGLVRSGELDGAIVLVESLEDAAAAFDRYRPRLRDTGYIWVVTRKRGHGAYVNQMQLVPLARRAGLIDNKTCSIDDERSGIRFVVPRALRRTVTSPSAAA